MEKYANGKPTDEDWKTIIEDDEKVDYSCAMDNPAENHSEDDDIGDDIHHDDHRDIEHDDPFQIDADNFYDFKQ